LRYLMIVSEPGSKSSQLPKANAKEFFYRQFSLLYFNYP